MLDWGRTVVGREPMATLPLTSSLLNGEVVPTPTLPVVPIVSPTVVGERRVPVRVQYPTVPVVPVKRFVIYPLAKYLLDDPKSRVLFASGPMFPATSSLKELGAVVPMPTLPVLVSTVK